MDNIVTKFHTLYSYHTEVLYCTYFRKYTYLRRPYNDIILQCTVGFSSDIILQCTVLYCTVHCTRTCTRSAHHKRYVQQIILIIECTYVYTQGQLCTAVHARTVHVQAQIMQCTCTAVGLHVQFLLLPKNSLLYTYSTVCKTMYHTVHNYTYCSPTVQRQTYSTIIKQLFIKKLPSKVLFIIRRQIEYIIVRVLYVYFGSTCTFVLSYFISQKVLSYFRTKVSCYVVQLLSKVLSQLYFRTLRIEYFRTLVILSYFRT